MNFKKSWLFTLILIFALMGLAACSGPKWVGTYGGTASSGAKVEITIEKNGSVTYNRNGTEYQGTWTKKENSLELNFDGQVSSSSEPLIITQSSDQRMITVESMNSGWNPDTYQRR